MSEKPFQERAENIVFWLEEIGNFLSSEREIQKKENRTDGKNDWSINIFHLSTFT